VAVGDENLSAVYLVAPLDFFCAGAQSSAAQENRFLNIGAGFRLGYDQVNEARISFFFTPGNVTEDFIQYSCVKGREDRCDAKVMNKNDMSQAGAH